MCDDCGASWSGNSASTMLHMVEACVSCSHCLYCVLVKHMCV